MVGDRPLSADLRLPRGLGRRPRARAQVQFSSVEGSTSVPADRDEIDIYGLLSLRDFTKPVS